ncbi:hypothetical protein Pyn_17192 [Prunus yedoensis var. nudiflora]|uniref:Uncharacterized protein n=1 Tax=Prunus yedoensis var. nudiflora TaxID=2094558 RepID=A0A314XKE3_PRUYE|nr:hypothetical protein Pyn_17192 [Prunus yedoensis var. nudiflora]
MWLGTRVPKVTQNLRVARRCGWHEGAEGDTKLACRKAMWLGTWVPKASKLACRKAMWPGTRVPKVHKACVSQGNVARHLGAEASQSLRVARRCGQARGCEGDTSLHVVRQCG